MQPSYLPESYIASLRELLGEETEAYLASLEEPPVESLRFHRGKWTPEEAQARYPALTDPVPWCDAGRYVPEEFRASREPAWFAGLYYIQEASAMSPGEVLPLAPGDHVLDLCAAPGGKATQLAGRMKGGVLYANDISTSRAKFLAMNLDRAGTSDCFVTAESPERLAACFPGRFQAVLADAPCSGEGMMHKDPAIRKDWLERGPAYYAPLQAEILDAAAVLTAPGGHLLFSTCTFSRLENEENVRKFLEKHPDFCIEPIPHRPGFSEGFLPGTVRIWPHRARGEGHFLALLRKAGGEDSAPVKSGKPAETAPPADESSRKSRQRAQQTAGPSAQKTWEKALKTHPFLQTLPETLRQGRRLLVRENRTYAVPAEETIPAGLHYLRTGLLLGEEEKGRFKPSQALAMALDGRTYPHTVSLPWGDETALRYLKGETVDAAAAEIRGEEGTVLVCLEHYPLGWAARKGTRLKNKLHPAWRYL